MIKIIDTKAVHDSVMKFWSKHPKLSKFVTEHEKGVHIACDVAMKVALLNLGYQLGKLGMLKTINSGVTDASAVFSLADEGKNLSVVNTCKLKCGIDVISGYKVTESSDLLKVVNVATEALKNQGVDIHAI